MIVHGIDLSANTEDTFGGYIPGRTLIRDGDGPAYTAAATAKTLPTAIKRMQQIIMADMFLTGSEYATVHLTAQSSAKAGRFNIRGVKPYQGQRTSKAKPPLLESVRQAFAREENWPPNVTVELHYELEADDGMMMESYRLKEHGVMKSEDKDLRMTPYPYWEDKVGKIIVPGLHGSLYPSITGAGTKKVLGYGRMFFWAQMLMGDTADNIAGIQKLDGKLCGPVAAYEALCDYKDENDAANAVLAGYRAINQNPLPEGYLLWMLRHQGDSFWHYLQELRLSEANRSFVNDCVQRPGWFVQPEVQEEPF